MSSAMNSASSADPTDSSRTAGAHSPGPDRALDLGVVACALWTLALNVTVLAGGALDMASGAFALALLIALLVGRAARRSDAPRTSSAAPGATSGCARPSPGWLIVPLATAAGLWSEDPVQRWWIALAIAWVAAATATFLGRSASADLPPSSGSLSRSSLAILVILALLGALLATFCQRPDSDDGFYLNMAVAAADAPGAPLFALDTLHGLGPAPAWISIYQVQSFELAFAALARWTGLEPLWIAHVLAPALGAVLLPFALARAFRALTPKAWLPATLGALVFLVAAGAALNPYGEFVLLRLQQGKSWFVGAGVALLVAYALEFWSQRTRGSFVRLCAIQIACVGATSGALWMAPVIVGLILVGAALGQPLGHLRSTAKTFALGIASSTWPVVLALWVRSDLQAAVDSFTQQFDDIDRFVEAWERVFGADPLRWIVVAAVGLCPFLPASRTTRRVAAVFAVAFLTLFWNPYFDEWLARTLTGIPTYWRVFWILPVPLLVGLLLAVPFELASSKPALTWAARGVGSAALIAIAAVGFGSGQAVPQAKGISIAPPGIHIDAQEQAVTRAIVGATEPGDPVLAPRSITRWIVAYRGHPYPLVSRLFYLEPLRPSIGDAEVDRRIDLWRRTENGPFAAGELARAIRDYDLAALAVKVRGESFRGQQVPRSSLTAMRKTFRATGLRRVELDVEFEEPIYEVWARPKP